MKGIRKMISLWLAMCLAISMVPVQTFAQEETVAETAVMETIDTTAETTLSTEAAEETTVPTETEEETTATEESIMPETETLTVIDEAVGAEVTASGTCGENLTWSLDSEGVLTISGNGDMPDYYYNGLSGAPWFRSRGQISHVVVENGVSSIGNCAFDSCSNLKSIQIPDSVTRIGDDAFDGCSSLSSIVLSENITEIGSYAFDNCTSLSSIKIPSSLSSIGTGVFCNCSGVTDVVIQDGIEALSQNMFMKCTGLIRIVIPDGVQSIGMGAFNECTSLTSISIPNSVTSIGQFAFEYCTSLADIYYTGDETQWKLLLENIGSNNDPLLNAMIHCSGETGEDPGLISGTCGENLTWTFDEDTGCLTVSGSGMMYDDYNGHTWYSKFHRNITSVIIAEGVTHIGNEAFTYCDNLVSISIPDSVTSIGMKAFYYCSKLTNVSIPRYVTSIGKHAFQGCSSLPAIELPDGITDVGEGMFYGCSSLARMTIPNGVTSIGINAFGYCSNLMNISIPNTVSSIDDDCFFYCSNLAGISIPDGITSIEDDTFYGCKNLASIYIPATVTRIKMSAFSICSNLKDVYYGGSEEEWATLLENTDAGNDPLLTAEVHCNFVMEEESVTGTCGENLTWKLGAGGTLTISGTGEMTNWTGAASVPWNAVASSITGVVVESGVTGIGTYAFSGCTALTNVTLPDTLEKIGYAAFEDCSQLTDIVIPKGVASIEKSTFSDCSNLIDVTLPSGLGRIGASAFYHCENLNDILIPDGVTEIDSFAFDHCTNLKTVLLPNTLKTIGSYAFRDCVSLANFRIPEGTKTLNNGAFLGCKALKSIIIPETVTSLGDNVFTQCSGLTSVVISAKVKELPLGLFDDCEDLTTITLPVTLTSVKDNAFNGCNDLECVYYGGTKQQWDAFVPSKVGTGNDPLTDPDLQLRCQEYSPEIALLEKHAEDWYAKYEEYIQAVITVLNELPADIEESRSEQIRKSAERMKKHDKNSDDKYIAFTYSITNMAFCPEEYKDACYLALAEALYDNLAEQIDFSKVDFSDYTDGGITNIVAKNIVNVNQEYSCDDVTVMIKIVGFGQTMNGSLSCTAKSTRKAPYEALLKCPQEMYLEEMGNLCKELSELGIASVDNGYTAFAEDILAGALHEMNEAKLQEKLGSTANGILKDAEEEFISYGTGKFIDAVKSCNRYFTFLVKPIQDGNSTDLIRETNLYGVAGIDFESFYDLDEYELEGLQVDSRVRKALTKLEKASEKLEKATEEYLDGELSVNSKFSWKSFFNCPVNVSVFDSAGTQIGYVGEDDIWYHDNIIIEETAGAKIVSSLTDEILSFRIVATDYGTMSCSFEEYNEVGLPVGRLNFYDIPLAPNQNFQAELQEGLDSNQNDIQIKTADINHNCSEYIPATEDAAVTILGTAVADDGTAGGTVSGGGTFTRGDAAILLAIPEIGYSFNGWYQENILISLNTVYEFTAKEDVVLTAQFRRNDDLRVCVVAEGGGSAVGNGRFSHGDTAEVLAVAQSGYQFTGWYQDGVLISDKDNYSFAVTENVTLIAKFEKTVNLTKTVPMHRMYDPNSGEHFYTGSEVERDFLVEAGWSYEGVGFNFPEEGEPVYRLYEPTYGEHLYTMDKAEKEKLLSWGWNDEGVAFNSAEDDEVPQYRLHNPNAKRGGYHFTGSIEERDFLISIGWINEGIGWYSCVE